MSPEIKAELNADMAEVIKAAEPKDIQSDSERIIDLETAILKMAGVVNEVIEIVSNIPVTVTQEEPKPHPLLGELKEKFEKLQNQVKDFISAPRVGAVPLGTSGSAVIKKEDLPPALVTKSGPGFEVRGHAILRVDPPATPPAKA